MRTLKPRLLSSRKELSIIATNQGKRRFLHGWRMETEVCSVNRDVSSAKKRGKIRERVGEYTQLSASITSTQLHSALGAT